MQIEGLDQLCHCMYLWGQVWAIQSMREEPIAGFVLEKRLCPAKSKATQLTDGNCANFPRTLNLLKQLFHTKKIQSKRWIRMETGKVSLHCIYYVMRMSSCQICYAHV